MSATTTRRLLEIHRWTGLVTALNLSVLALTGIILLFEKEAEEVVGAQAEPWPEPVISLAKAVAMARDFGEPIALSRSMGDFPAIVFVSLRDHDIPLAIDMVSGSVLREPPHDDSFGGVVFRLHSELLAGPRGLAVVGLIGMCFLTSLITGAFVYLPMIRFARPRSFRATIAAIHKTVGVAILVWGLVVATTGVILAIAMPLARTHAVSIATMASMAGTTIDDAVKLAEATGQRRRWWNIVIENGGYGIVLRGGEGAERRVITVVRDSTQEEQPVRTVLELARLYFADYGGLPLRIVWAIFALGLLAMVTTGLTMRVARRIRARAR